MQKAIDCPPTSFELILKNPSGFITLSGCGHKIFKILLKARKLMFVRSAVQTFKFVPILNCAFF